MVRGSRPYQAVAGGVVLTLGLWFIISRFYEFNTVRWHSDEYIAIFHGKLPTVPQYRPDEKPWIPSASLHREESEDLVLLNNEILLPSSTWRDEFSSSTSKHTPAPIPTSSRSPIIWNSAWNDRETWPERLNPTQILREVLDSENNKTVSQMRCPTEIGARYTQLQNTNSGQIQYFFALNLYQSAGVLARLMGSIVEAIQYLGPERCAVSVVDGRSSDGTYEILAALKPRIEDLGGRFFLTTSDINPSRGEIDQVEALAELRNQALAPLKVKGMDELAGAFASDALLIFLNNIAPCPEDILELVFQHVNQGAHMTCAFDWIDNGTVFNDVWVSRSLVGNTFIEISHDASSGYSTDMFFDDPGSRQRYYAFQPVQVYSCWGGMVTLDAAPFVSETVKFRASADGECYMGEPTLLGKDLFRHGFGKILAVPAVNVAYSDEEAVGTKHARGYVADHVNISEPLMDQEELVSWQLSPPSMIKCLPYWDQPSWVPSV